MACCLIATTAVEAQVFVRAPFVRVQVGGGVAVRAPFVRLYLPPGPPSPVYYSPPVYLRSAPVPFTAPLPTPELVPVAPLQAGPPADDAPPAPQQAANVMTPEAFVKAFQPKAGSYEIELLNPVTQQPTPVRFTLPEGTPRRVNVTRREIEFSYGPRQFVRIEFDQDGALVTSR
jgi:hypothetical protein